MFAQVIGLGDGRTYIASETAAFSKYTRNFIALRDGEICVVTPSRANLDISRIEVAPNHDVLLTPAPHKHFTIKECLEQPEAIARALSFGARMSDGRIVLGGLDKRAKELMEIKNLLMVACGTSKHAAEFGAKIMRDLECFDTVGTLDAAEVIGFALLYFDVCAYSSVMCMDIHRCVTLIFRVPTAVCWQYLSQEKRRTSLEQ